MRIILAILFSVFFFSAGFALGTIGIPNKVTQVVEEKVIVEKTLEKYSIENLKNTNFRYKDFQIQNVLEEEENYTSYVFDFNYYPALNNELKKTTGLLNLPNADNVPIVILIRGYVDPTAYQTGVGSYNASAYFADKGYISMSPDFLGYAGSDINSTNIFESRFQTYVTILSLLRLIEDKALPEEVLSKWDRKNINIWAHSNGGQIALTALVTKGYGYPTSLWAPVTKSFPYSILYYTDESDDGGKLIRRELANFEKIYDTDKYAFNKYLDDLNAPIQIHQGTSDNAVPYGWNREFSKILENNGVEVEYFEYISADHNLRPSWDEAIVRTEAFFQSNKK